ncbi:MAG TPA: hypothetical protein VFR17_08155 [Mycobacterium sp.]|nr:hypothetical protein [Mycobacterium sp.]
MSRGRRSGFGRIVAAAGAVLLTALAVPVPAFADETFWEMNNFTEVNSAPYSRMFDMQNFSGGYQFSTPAGYRCRMQWLTSATEAARGECWGALPGTSDNWVHMSSGEEAVFGNTDVARFDEHPDGQGGNKPFTAADYPLLPAGSKISRKSVQITCAVRDVLTACITDAVGNRPRHGFALQPSGNVLF